MGLLVATAAIAFPCERTLDPDSCRAVLIAGLPEHETQSILASMIADTRAWNGAITPQGPPAGTSGINRGIVRNAWVRILAVTPSAYDGDVLLIPAQGEVLTLHSYKITTPSGTERGDCRTRYSLQYTSTLDIRANGKLIGHDRVSAYTVDSDADFQAELRITIRLAVKHYDWQYDDDGKRCVYSRTEQRKDVVTVSDSLSARLHRPKITARIETLADQNGGVEIRPVVLGAMRYTLRAGDAVFEQQSAELEPFLGPGPYYPFQQRVRAVNRTRIEGMRYGNQGIVVVPSVCSFELSDYFTSRAQSCAIDANLEPLSISTERTFYQKGEDVHVHVNGADSVQLSYADTVQIVAQDATLKAAQGHSMIHVQAGGRNAWKAISVESGAWDSVWAALSAAPVVLVLWRAARFALGAV
ncbi:MAG: hypothetical protein AABY13_03460 [Nanoarchaeota archaeon]